ncbi:MAG: hypothetical protein U0935_00950 [Pirellulales bacterium]
MKSWSIRSLFSRSNRRQKSPHRAVRRLFSEMLEDRRLLAVTALFDGVNTLNVALSGSADQVFLSYDGTNIDVGTVDGGSDVYNGSDAITKVVVTDTGAAGSQQVTISGANAIPATINQINVNGVETAHVNQAILSALVGGDASTVNVTAPGQIQDGIGLAASGAVVNVSAGTYAENVILDRQVTLRGAQSGVDARGRVVGAPNPAVETIVAPPSGRPVELQDAADNTTIDGFSIIGSLNGADGAISSQSGAGAGNNALQIKNNYVAVAAGFNASALFLNRSALEATIDRNVFVAAVGSSQAVFFDSPDQFHGLYFTNNDVLRSGGIAGTGWFVDGNRNVSNTGGVRNPLIQGNLFQGHSLGLNGGSRSFANTQFVENTFSGNLGGLAAGPKDSTIARNTFTSNDLYGLRLTSFGNTVDGTRGAQNTLVTNNFFSSNGTTADPVIAYGDIRLDNQPPGTQATNTITNNSLTSARGLFYSQTVDTINASGNWWGTNTDVGVQTKVVRTHSEGQTFTVSSAVSGGTFTLTFNAATTVPLSYNAPAATVQSALETLGTIGLGNVAVYGGGAPGTAYNILFQGVLANTDVAGITGSAAGLVGGGFSQSPATLYNGVTNAPVDYTPWLDVGTDTNLATAGFQGSYTVLHVDDNSAQVGATTRINEALGLLTTGTAATVVVHAGSYAESVSVNRADLTAVTVQGATGIATDVIVNPAGVDGFTISAPANVTLQDLRITGANNGLTATGLTALTLSNLAIDGSTSGGTIGTTPTVTFAGSPGADTLNASGTQLSSGVVQAIAHSGISTLQLNGLAGLDSIHIALGASLPTSVNVDGGSAPDSVNVQGSASNDSLTLAGSTLSTGSQTIGLANTESLTLDLSQAGTDSVNINEPVTQPSSSIQVTGGGAGSDTLTVDTGTAAATVSIDDNSVDITGQAPIGYTALDDLYVQSGNNSDTFTVTPSAVTVIHLDANDPTSGSGDVLNYLTPSGSTSTIYLDRIESAGYQAVYYQEFETINLGGDVTVVGTGLNDVLTVNATGAAAGSYVLTTNLVAGPTVGLAGVTKFTFSGLAGNDKLVINNPAASLFGPVDGISFLGGADLDALEILGGAGSSGSYTPGPAADAGSLTQVSGLITQNVSFTGLEPIVHTTALTSFTVNGSGSGDVINVVDGPNLSGTQTVEINFNGAFEKIQLANKTTATVLAGAGSDTFNINYSAAPTGVSTLALNGEANASTFNVQASTPGALATHLVGGSSGDDFVFSDGAVLSGNANGNAGSDTLNLSANTSARTVTLSAAGGTDGFNGSGNSLTSFSNIDVLSGGSASDSLTQGLDTATSWNLSGSNAGNVQVAGPSRTLTFSSVENLTGANTASDSFLWGVGTGISGALNARGGNDNLNYSSYGASITVDLTAGTAGNIGGGIATDGVGSSIENLYGSNQADTLTGDADANLIRGNDGADTINAKGGTDDVDGNDGDDDILVAGTEAEFDLIQGGLGNDQIYNVGGGTVTLNGFNSAFDSWDNSIEEYLGAGFAVSGNSSANGLHFGFTSLTNTTGVNSGVNNDSVTTSYNNGSLVAYDGDAGTDQVTLVFTPTQLDALTTADILVVQDYVAAPTGKTLTVTNVVAKGNFTATNFETARLAVHDDGLILDITTCFSQVLTQDQIVTGGDATDDVINGTALVDLIFGQGGNDTINGLDAGDCLFGGAGNDVINGNAGGDMISGGSGNDTLNGQSDSDAIYGGLGDDTLTGDLGFDSLFGNAGNDSLDGGLNDDVLNGGAGTDTIAGGDGYDTIQVRTDEAEFDSMNGGNNTDTVLNISAAPVILNAFNAGTSSIEAWNGNSQPILGNSGPNVITFLITPTYSMTLTGVPYVDGADGNDHITGTFGADNLRGGSGNDTLLGLGGVDTLRGGADNDSLNGGDGVDYLYGDDGVDTITSGAGRDVIYFAGDLASEDVITDLALYSDTINLAAYGVTYANLSFAIVAPNTTINIAPSNKKIKLLNWTRVVPSSQFVFV